jgi:methionyl-tRNA formyltransferase
MQTALKNGEKTTALSWIKMTKQMDSGDISLQIPTKIEPKTDFQSLANFMGNLGSKTWALAIFAEIMKYHGRDFCLKQDPNLATFCSFLEKKDRLIDPENFTAEEIFNHFRGLKNFPGTWFLDTYFKQEIKILKADFNQENQEFIKQNNFAKHVFWRVLKIGKKQQVFLECKNSTFLEIQQICTQSGKKIDFSGYQFV